MMNMDQDWLEPISVVNLEEEHESHPCKQQVLTNTHHHPHQHSHRSSYTGTLHPTFIEDSLRTALNRAISHCSLHHLGEEWLQEHVQTHILSSNHSEFPNLILNSSQKDLTHHSQIKYSIFLKMRRMNHHVAPHSHIHCKKPCHEHIVQSSGSLHFVKPFHTSSNSLSSVHHTTRTSWKDKMIQFVSSEDFGMTSMMICPPLLLAHWYATYQRDSPVLNCAQYVECGWCITQSLNSLNDHHTPTSSSWYLEKIATLYKYPRKIEKKLSKYSSSELQEMFPTCISVLRVPLERMIQNGLNIEISSHHDEEGHSLVYNVHCGVDLILCQFTQEEFAVKTCQVLHSLLKSVIEDGIRKTIPDIQYDSDMIRQQRIHHRNSCPPAMEKNCSSSSSTTENVCHLHTRVRGASNASSNYISL
ncbi:hypothetical protein C9374_008515 [Naegleria lovaniensis]|uniref:Uncharacterized protein n=1 Tax=Naegleria lovaniensis TaxID=51637 RepID=A0AA88KFJ5_NAELO|nr:uncharacterized protein C9374_008515 [Naegleria lovaniensis]KAG2378372.1 hypothetical protein C9374_008515 [Naegleria lovaniensis]